MKDKSKGSSSLQESSASDRHCTTHQKDQSKQTEQYTAALGRHEKAYSF
jgi:hypothetical protein